MSKELVPSNDTVIVNDVTIEAITYRGQRILTFDMVAKVHKVPVDSIRRAYSRNSEYFIDGKHVYLLQGDDLEELIHYGTLSPRVPSIRVFTELGYLLLIKTMRDPISWRVQGEMAETYFRVTHQLVESRDQSDDKYAQAISTMSMCKALGEFFETPKHIMMIEAKKELAKIGIDASPYLLASPAMDDVPSDNEYLEPTELGRRWNMSGAEMNKALARLGLQAKVNQEWIPTDNADGMCSKHAWSNGTKSGYNLKWNVSKVDALINRYQIGAISQKSEIGEDGVSWE